MHTANCLAVDDIGSINKAFDLEIPAPDSVRFVPVYLGLSDSAVLQAHPSNPFALSPPSSAIALSQAGDFANGSTDCESFCTRKVSNNCKVHMAPICCHLTKSVYLTPSRSKMEGTVAHGVR